MKEAVRIKSFAKGLILQLDDRVSFDEILEETASKFLEGKAFFGRASVAISFQGRELTDEQQFQMIDVIQNNCDLKVICIVGKDEEKDKFFLKAMQYAERQQMADTVLLGEEIQVFRGSLTDGEKLDTPSSIIILGNVESGCAIRSERSILIMGCLYGEAAAGVADANDGANCFVAALEMAPESLSIGDFIYTSPKKTMWGKKKNERMMAAKVQDGKIQISEFTNELLSGF